MMSHLQSFSKAMLLLLVDLVKAAKVSSMGRAARQNVTRGVLSRDS